MIYWNLMEYLKYTKIPNRNYQAMNGKKENVIRRVANPIIQ